MKYIHPKRGGFFYLVQDYHENFFNKCSWTNWCKPINAKLSLKHINSEETGSSRYTGEDKVTVIKTICAGLWTDK